MKRFLSVLTLLILLLSIASCTAGDSDVSDPGSSAPTSAPQTSAGSDTDAEPEGVKYPIVTDGSVTLSWF
jgi:hypothetical protein